MIVNLAVPVRAEETGEDRLERAGGHAAVLSHADKLGERRQPRPRAVREVRIDAIADKGDRTL